MVAGEQEEAGNVHSRSTHLKPLASIRLPSQRRFPPPMSDRMEHVNAYTSLSEAPVALSRAVKQHKRAGGS